MIFIDDQYEHVKLILEGRWIALLGSDRVS